MTGRWLDQLLGRRDATMTGDDLIRAIDQHWIKKAEALDAAGNLGDLPA